MLDTAETVVCCGSDRVDWSRGKSDFEAGVVRTFSRSPSALGEINVPVSIVDTVEHISIETNFNAGYPYCAKKCASAPEMR